MIAICVIQAPEYWETYEPVYEYFNLDFFTIMTNYGVFIYSYCCITTFHLAKDAMKDPNTQRLSKITLRYSLLVWMAFTIYGIMGYLSLGVSVKNITIYPERKSLEKSSDLINKVGKYLLV